MAGFGTEKVLSSAVSSRVIEAPRARNWKPALTLIALSAVLTELLSGNQVFSVFLQPFNLIILLSFGYGLPVLAIRELWVRKGWGLPSLLTLGLVYGMHNEGVLAKTFFAAVHHPAPSMVGYGAVGQLNAAWALAISTWHAVHAVVIPILVTHALFPTVQNQPWLTVPKTWLAFLLSIAGGALLYFWSPLPTNKALWYAAMLAAAALLYAAASLQGSGARPETVAGARPHFWLGFFAPLLYLWLPAIISGLKLPAALCFGASGLALYLLYRAAKTMQPWALNVQLKTLLGTLVFSCISLGVISASVRGPLETIPAAVLFLAGFYVLHRKTRAEDVALAAG